MFVAHIDCNNPNVYIIHDEKIIPNVVGKHLEIINTENKENDQNISTLKNLVEKQIKEKWDVLHNNTPLSTFDNNNTASKPTTLELGNGHFTNVIEVRSLIKHMSNKTSTGWDNIPNIIIKHLNNKCIKHYTIIFNNCINLGYYPNAWKVAKVIALKKKKDKPNILDNLRPISLLPPISKIFERILEISIDKFCHRKGIIPDHQFFFKNNHSTLHAVNKIVSDVNWHLLNNELVGAMLIDLRKAFDSVWLDGLVYKLLKQEANFHLVKLINNTIKGRKFRVAIGEHISDHTFSITKGLQQGTVNSPVLFNIFTAKLLELFGINEEPKTYGIAFADDLVIYVADKNIKTIEEKLQTLYNKIKTFYTNWGLKINASKCESILFRNVLSNYTKKYKKIWKQFQLNDKENDIITPIPHKNQVRYLGVILDERLRFNIHINIQLEKASNTFKKLHKLFYSPYTYAKKLK